MDNYLLPEVKGWDDWRLVFTDVELWRPVIQHLWGENQVLRVSTDINVPAHVEATYPGTGAVFLVNSAAIIKIFPPFIVQDFHRELSVYNLIADRIPYLPRLLASDIFHDRIEWPYLVMERLPGEAWRDVKATLDRKNQTAVLHQLGQLVSAVHAITLPISGSWPAESAWEDFLAVRLPQIPNELHIRTALPHSVIVEAEGFLSAMNWHAVSPCLLHADLTEDHLLLVNNRGNWEISGLIDWADAEVGHPTYEWVTLWFSICGGDSGLLDAFMSGYNPVASRVTSNHLLAYTLLHRFGATIIGERLSPTAQRTLLTLDELKAALFPGLPSGI